MFIEQEEGRQDYSYIMMELDTHHQSCCFGQLELGDENNSLISGRSQRSSSDNEYGNTHLVALINDL